MEKQRLLEEEKQYNTIIDIQEDENPEDELFDEVAMLLAVKNGELPPEAVKAKAQYDEDEDDDDWVEKISEDEYENTRLEIEKRNDELNQLINRMNKDDDEDENEIETSEEDIYEEILRLKNTSVGSEDIVEPEVVENEKESEPDEEETRVITVGTLGPAEEVTQTGYTLCRPVKSAYIKKTLRKSIVQEVKEEPVPVKSVSFQMLLDETISYTEIEPVNDEEKALTEQISNLLVKYIAMKGVETSELDLAIDLSFTTQVHQEKVTDNEIIIINNKSTEVEEVEPIVVETEHIEVQEVKTEPVDEEESDDEYGGYMEALMGAYVQNDEDLDGYQEGKNYNVETTEILIQDDDMLEEELKKMYDEL